MSEVTFLQQLYQKYKKETKSTLKEVEDFFSIKPGRLEEFLKKYEYDYEYYNMPFEEAKEKIAYLLVEKIFKKKENSLKGM
jgi:hypothetical protein